MNLTHGHDNQPGGNLRGQRNELLIGQTELVLEVSRDASDAASSAFTNLQVWIRAYLRADVAPMHPEHFVVITGVIP